MNTIIVLRTTKLTRFALYALPVHTLCPPCQSQTRTYVSPRANVVRNALYELISLQGTSSSPTIYCQLYFLRKDFSQSGPSLVRSLARLRSRTSPTGSPKCGIGHVSCHIPYTIYHRNTLCSNLCDSSRYTGALQTLQTLLLSTQLSSALRHSHCLLLRTSSTLPRRATP